MNPIHVDAEGRFMAKRKSPVVYAECRYAGSPEWLHVGVWFKNKQELDGLISALTTLRDATADDFNHVHLQQYGLSAASPVGQAEVMFFRPGRPIEEVEADMIDEASKWIAIATSDKQ